MFTLCCYHQIYFPEEVAPKKEIEPLENKGISHVMCNDCAKLFCAEHGLDYKEL